MRAFQEYKKCNYNQCAAEKEALRCIESQSTSHHASHPSSSKHVVVNAENFRLKQVAFNHQKNCLTIPTLMSPDSPRHPEFPSPQGLTQGRNDQTPLGHTTKITSSPPFRYQVSQSKAEFVITGDGMDLTKRVRPVSDNSSLGKWRSTCRSIQFLSLS